MKRRPLVLWIMVALIVAGVIAVAPFVFITAACAINQGNCP